MERVGPQTTARSGLGFESSLNRSLLVALPFGTRVIPDQIRERGENRADSADSETKVTDTDQTESPYHAYLLSKSKGSSVQVHGAHVGCRRHYQGLHAKYQETQAFDASKEDP